MKNSGIEDVGGEEEDDEDEDDDEDDEDYEPEIITEKK
eukprot:CAMPEP_0117019586 /NCGR_PEP_ID=MMETSP0472-20121206/15009_1 /TAXON_ID=693140 ORGANISM="Tiarina fusus, Strain LIS" /NCGR_SAMPLE_ID=MMETSP0472 /ASSEMBLY_ACC=CAM_ASM_000603 /LENGTH=37 /DNA_ID= /DNA_START= /DNA_END= /DNA_ORIENTATION=